MHTSRAVALVKNILILSQLFPLVKTINTKFLPCDTNLNETKVDCSDRPLKHVPFIKATSVAYIDLSRTKINRVWPHAFTGVPNLHTLKLSGNCQPDSPRALEDRSCRVKISRGVNGNVNGVIRQAFFMVQQRLLDEKVDVAVLVLMDKIFPKLKYLQLRKRLCRKSVLSWPHHPCAQPLFWNQMRMALSSDNLKFYDNNMSESFI
uniref:toll-like receptor 9 isoform X2 n=1 Tax=Maylandia zebra TaxID=106582 RepID=UPI00032A3FA7|nr:uncharacterized protein LOC101469110 isoform X2 [Maylandia zebra]